MFGVRPFRGCRWGREKNTGHVSGTSQLGLQTGGAGHNLGTPGGDALISHSKSAEVIKELSQLMSSDQFIISCLVAGAS